jgi:hypothetical protein
MNTQDIARLRVIDVPGDETMAEACAQVTTLIRDHGWELHEVVLTLTREGGPVNAQLALAHRDPHAGPREFGFVIERPQTRPA